MGFPCNQFGGQEPGTDEEVATFCTKNFGRRTAFVPTRDRLNAAFAAGVTFPLMKKSDVNGSGTNEVYKWLKDQKSWLFGISRVNVCLDFGLAQSGNGVLT